MILTSNRGSPNGARSSAIRFELRLRQRADFVPEHIRFESTGLSSGASVTRDVSAVPLSDAVRRLQ